MVEQDEQGPPMICATQVLQARGTRIGRIGGIQLPRTVEILTLFASASGAVAGLIFALIVNSGIQPDLFGLIIGGAIGWAVVSVSPLKGESMLKWIELQFNTTRRGRYIDGERVALAVGTALLDQTPRGRVRLLRSAVRIPASQYDERGVLVSAANRNLPGDGSIDPRLFAALNLPGEGSMTMSPVDDTLRTSRRPAPTVPPSSKRTGATSPTPQPPATRPATGLTAVADAGSPQADGAAAPLPPDAGSSLRAGRHKAPGAPGAPVSKPRRLKD